MKKTVKQFGKRFLSMLLTLVMLSTLIVPEVITFTSVADGYTPNTSWDYSGSELHITSAADLLQFIDLADKTTDFSGKTIYLDCDIDLNPGWSAEVTIDTANNALIYPTAPATVWTNVGSCVTSGTTSQKREPRKLFKGTFDGQGHTISGIYSYRNKKDEANHFGLLFNKVDGGTVKNLAVTNSIIIFTTTANNSESAYGGLVGGVKNNGNLQNLYTDVTMVMAAASGKKNSLAFGGISGWFGGDVFENCVFAGSILTANAYEGTTYPATGVTWVIGGVTGEQEGGTTRNLLGIPKTVLTAVPTVEIQGVDQKNANNSTGGYNPVIAGHYNTGYGTRGANVLAGPQSAAPAGSDWLYVTTLESYVPAYIANTFFSDAIVDPGELTSYEITVSASNATVTVYSNSSFIGGTQTNSAEITGDTFYFSVAPNTGYEVTNVAVSGTYTGITHTGNNYTITGVESDLTVTATVAEISYDVTASATNATLLVYGDDTFTDGTATNAATVGYGDSFYFTATPDEGYEISAITVDGTYTAISAASGVENGYVITGVTSDLTVTVTTEVAGSDDPGEGEGPQYDATSSLTVTTEPDTSWYNDSDTTFTIDSAAKLLGFAQLLHDDTDGSLYNYFYGKTFNLTVNVDLNKGADLSVTIAGTAGSETFTPPTAPNNAWPRFNIFRGTFNGGGHTIKGIYLDATATEDTGYPARTGIFGELDGGATVQDLVIKNSYVALHRGSSNAAAQFFVGGLASAFQDPAGELTVDPVVIRNVYADIDVAAISNGQAVIGGIAAVARYSDGTGDATIENVIFAGNIMHFKEDGTRYNNSSSLSAQIAALCYGTGSTYITNALALGSHYTYDTKTGQVTARTAGYDPIARRISGVTQTNCYTSLINADAPDGWIYCDYLKGYAPATLAGYLELPAAQIHIANDEPIANFNLEDGSGSSYVIENLEDLNQFATLANEHSDYMIGKTFKLGADIVFNADFDATDTVTNFKNAPTNTWTIIDTFKGTFDGQGHKIVGLYSIQSKSATNLPGTFIKGGLFNYLDGATIRNLVITNAFIGCDIASAVDWASSDQRFGGIAGKAMNGTTIENVVFDAEVFVRHNYRMTYGGIFSIGEGDITLRDFVYSGHYGYISAEGVYYFNVDTYTQGDKKFGYLMATGSGATVTLDNVLVLATRGVYNMSAPANAGEDGKGYLVHWSNGNTTLDNALIGAQTEAIDGWTYDANFASFTPTSLTTTTPIQAYVPKTQVDAPMSAFDSRDTGSYLITSAADLKTFNKIGQEGHDFANQTFKLTTDIDLNAGWSGYATIENDAVTFPDTPSYKWTPIPEFRGVLDGQGHSISGIYSYGFAGTLENEDDKKLYSYTLNSGSYEKGGIFTTLRNATIKDLVFTNTFLGIRHDGKYGSINQKFGGMAYLIDTSTIQNVFFNAEVWFKTNYHKSFGAFAVAVNGSITFDDVVFAGRFAVCSSADAYTEGSGSNQKGILAANGAGATINISDVLIAAEIGPGVLSQEPKENNIAWLVHYTNGGTSGAGTAKFGLQTAAVEGWTWDNNLLSYSPTTLTAKYIRMDVDAPISSFNETAKVGSSYLITSRQDLLNFMQIINNSEGKGAGYVFKLTTDVDLNPGWSARVEIKDATPGGCGQDSGTIAFPSAPSTSWQISRFDGTFDGQGHYIAGIYRASNGSGWQKIGGFCDQPYGATIKNLKLVNGLVAVYNKDANARAGALAGIAHDSNDTASGGTPFTAENVYIDMNIWISSDSANVAGGIIGQPEQNAVLRNITFVGTVGYCRPSSSGLDGKTLKLPSSSDSASVGQAIGDPKGTGTILDNIVLAGVAYYKSGSHSGAISGTGNGEQRTLSNGSQSNVLVGKYASIAAATSAGAITNASNPTFTYVDFGTEGYLVTNENAQMGLTGLPDGRPTIQSIQDYAPNTFVAGSVFTIATPADLLYAAELSQSGVTFNKYTLRLTADIDLNPGWDAAFELSNYREFNESREDKDDPKKDEDGNVLKDENDKPIYNKKDYYIYSYDVAMSAVPAVTFPGFKNFYGTLDGQDHTISGIAMYKTFTKQDNLGFVDYLYGTIKNVKFNNGLIFAQTKNYNQSDSKIGGIAARIQSSGAVLENLYVGLEVWVQSGSAHRIGGIAGKVENGAHLTNIVFAGVVGTMRFSGEGGTVPSQSTGLSISQLVADGNWKSALHITNCNMAGTVYADRFAEKPTDTEISANVNSTNVTDTGEATYTGSAYSNTTEAFNIWPTATADRYTESYEADTMTKTYYFETITRANFNSYINALKAAGYTEEQNYSIGDSAYYLLQNGVYTLFVSRIPSYGYTGGEMFRARLYVEPYGRDYNTNKTATAKSSYCQAQLWQVNVDNWYSKSSGGACYIMRLTDGRFLIVDSGFGSAQEGDNIYKILYENNVRDGNPIVAGWFFTHAHEDHVKGLERFVKESHLNDIEVEAFYFNFPSHEVELAASESSGDGLSIKATTATRFAMTAFPDAKIYSRVHSGQTFGFADATVTVLYTHEDAGQSYWSGTSLVKNELRNGNDTSVMYQVTIGDEKILFTGDAYIGADNAVYYTYPASSYASKFVTVSHHGYEGLSKTFYQAVNPTVALWPMDLVRYVKNDSTGEYEPAGLNDEFSFKYRYEYTHSGNRMWEASHWFNTASSVKEVIPAFENACLTLPYTAKTYSGGSKTVDLTNKYNTKANNRANWDGVGGAGVTINEWYDVDADELYINNRKDLFDFMKAAQKGQTFAGQTVILTADISVNPSWSYNGLIDNNFLVDAPDGLSVWQPVPNFAGTFDGQGHTIRNLYTYVSVSTGSYYGGFFRSLSGGAVVQNLIIKNSAMVAKYDVTNGSQSTRIGGFVGRIIDNNGEDGPAILTNLYIDIDVYYQSGGIAAVAGLVGTVQQTEYDNPEYDKDAAEAATEEEPYEVPKKLKRTGQFVIQDVVYAGDIVCVAQSGQAGGSVNIGSDQEMWGPIGLVGKSEAPMSYEEDLTRTLNNVLYIGTLVPFSNNSEHNRYSSTLSSFINFGLQDVIYGEDTFVNVYGEAVTTEVEGWTMFADLGSLIPDNVFAMLDAIAKPVVAQQSAVSESNTVDLRFIGVLQDVFDEAELDDYSEVGMLIVTKRGDTELSRFEVTTTTVYESLLAGEGYYSMEDAGGFLYAFTIKGVAINVGGTEVQFYVTTFSVKADKTLENRKVYNEEVMFSYDSANGGLQQASAED